MDVKQDTSFHIFCTARSWENIECDFAIETDTMPATFEEFRALVPGDYQKDTVQVTDIEAFHAVTVMSWEPVDVPDYLPLV